MSFREYVAQRRMTRTPSGDFVGDAKQDPGLPDAKTWTELETYLRTKGAIPDAMAAAKAVWQGYLASQRQGSKSHAQGT